MKIYYLIVFAAIFLAGCSNDTALDKKITVSEIQSGIMNLANSEEEYFATSGTVEYTSDLDLLTQSHYSMFNFDRLLEISNVNVEVVGSKVVISAQSKKFPSILITFDSETQKFTRHEVGSGE